MKKIRRLDERFEKVFDPNRKRHYYYDKEKDKSSWRKPRLYMNSDVSKVSPTYSDDEAAAMIQTRFRMNRDLFIVRLLYQQNCNVSKIDERNRFSGNNYFNKMSGTTRDSLPTFMGGKLDWSSAKKNKLSEC